MTQLPIFIDFEGNLNNEQFLLGVGIDGKVKQVVLDERLKPLLLKNGYNLIFTPLQEACEQLIQICRERSTPLAGFTMHDPEVIESAIDRRIDVEYINLHQQVKKGIVTLTGTRRMKVVMLLLCLSTCGFPHIK